MKLCKDCKWAAPYVTYKNDGFFFKKRTANENWSYAKCGHPHYLMPVDGTPIFQCSELRTRASTGTMCGIDGEKWELRHAD